MAAGATTGADDAADEDGTTAVGLDTCGLCTVDRSVSSTSVAHSQHTRKRMLECDDGASKLVAGSCSARLQVQQSDSANKYSTVLECTLYMH